MTNWDLAKRRGANDWARLIEPGIAYTIEFTNLDLPGLVKDDRVALHIGADASCRVVVNGRERPDLVPAMTEVRLTPDHIILDRWMCGGHSQL